MSTVANLNVSVTAGTADFESSMQRINIHALTSRHTLHTLGEIAGVSGSQLGHLAHAFMSLPGPIGIVIGTVYAAKEAFDYFKEAAAKAAEVAKKFGADWAQAAVLTREADSILGKSQAWNKYEANARGAATKLFDEIMKNNKEMEEQGTIAAKHHFDAINTYLGKQYIELNNLADKYHDLGSEMGDLRGKELDIKITGGATEQVDLLRNLNEQYLTLAQALRNIPKDAAEWGNIKKEFDNVSMAMEEINKQMDKAEKSKLDTRLEAQAKFDDAYLNQQLESLHKYNIELKHSADLEIEGNKTEFEKLQEHLEKIRNEYENHYMTLEEMQKATARANLDYDISMTRANLENMKGEDIKKNSTLALSHAVSIDSAEVEGLKNRKGSDLQSQMLKEQKETNNHLQELLRQKRDVAYGVAG